MIYILSTRNVMTTNFYYSVIKRALDSQRINSTSVDWKDNPKMSKEDILIIGSAMDAFKYFLRGFKNIIVWFQGAVPEERLMQGCGTLKYKVMSIIEKFVLRHSLFNIFVSEAMRAHYEKKYGISFKESKYYVMPCFNEPVFHEESISKKNDLKSKIVFVYCGGTGIWQCLQETINVCKEIKKSNIGSVSEFRFYTNDVETISSFLTDSGLNDCVCKYISQDKLEEALQDCDFGFVLRKESIVNNVATPTKLSTYIANGVVPIVSNCIKDFCSITSGMNNVIQCKSLNAQEIVMKIQQYIDNSKRDSIKNEYNDLFGFYFSAETHAAKLGERLHEIVYKQ